MKEEGYDFWAWMSMPKRLPQRSPNRMARYEASARFPTGLESIRKLLKKLGPVEQLRVCYEAG